MIPARHSSDDIFLFEIEDDDYCHGWQDKETNASQHL